MGAAAWLRPAMAALAGAALGASAVMMLQGNADPGRGRVERIVHDYVLAHPEIIPEAMKRLQERETKTAVAARREAIEAPFGSAWAGAKDGDVVLVEFFDYACTFCRKSNPDVERLLREDRGLKVVWRELPVLGPDSQIAAEASLAAARAGKFKAFHDAMFAAGRPSQPAIAAAQRAAGLSGAVGGAEARAEIEKNIMLARDIGASGTPTFVVGDKVLQGAVGYDALKAAIAEARKGP